MHVLAAAPAPRCNCRRNASSPSNEAPTRQRVPGRRDAVDNEAPTTNKGLAQTQPQQSGYGIRECVVQRVPDIAYMHMHGETGPAWDWEYPGACDGWVTWLAKRTRNLTASSAGDARAESTRQSRAAQCASPQQSSADCPHQK